MAQDIISDCLNMIMNAKKAGKGYLEVSRYSKFLFKILDIAKKYNYIDYNLDERTKKLKIKILKLNKCKAIKPRFYVTLDDIDKYIRRFLPSRNFGIIIISTSSDLLTHKEAYEKNIGGGLIAYFY